MRIALMNCFVALLLAGCSGRDAGIADRARAAERPSVRALAVQPATTITPTQLLDWAQLQFPTLFPPGPLDQQLSAGGVSYTLRYYPGTANYLGVGNADGIVYGLGAFSNFVVTAYGPMSDFSCDVLKTCTRVTPDGDGNLGAGFARVADFSVRAGDQVMFEGLSPLDQIVEVDATGLSSAQLCTQAALPAGAAHAVPAQSPIPAGPYAGNQFSGPYRTYPAGVYALSVGSDACGFVERTSACVTPNEAALLTLGGRTLCAVTPYLMNPKAPSQAANNPPVANPACVPNRTLDSTWSDPGVQGVFLRMDWKVVNPAYGSYDWTTLDREATQALRYGKTITIGIRVGNDSIPDWVFASGDPKLGAAKALKLKDWGSGADSLPDGDCGTDYTLASPSDAAFKSLFKKLLADMAAHIRADQRRFSVLAGVKITGMGLHTLENRMPNRCAVAVRNPALGDTGTQGHIITMESQSLAAPVFDTRYNLASNPATGRIRDVRQCVCNPQILQYAGYTPSRLQAFYTEVEATLREGLGYKQMVFMNISDGFPQIGETGRFLGDHLKPPITSITINAQGQSVTSYGPLRASIAMSPADVPDHNDTTSNLILDGRNGAFAGGDLTAARGFGVENAALGPIGFATRPNSGLQCSQQVGIATSGAFAGSAVFPIAASARVDATTAGCPNNLATKEGVAYDKAGGFQVTAGLEGARDVDAALWNLTLNSNGLFFEYYETDSWRTRMESALNAGAVLHPEPPVIAELATPNHASATPKSGVMWNQLLLARAAAFSADPRHINAYQANPFPSAYTVAVTSAAGASRYVFNSRACQAYADRGTPVRINRISILN